MNLASQINGSTWALHKPALMDLQEFLADPDKFSAFETENEGEFSSRLINQEGSLAVIEVHGKIMPRSNILTRSSGATSTPELTSAVEEVEANEDIKHVLFHIDSPGGSPTGLSNLTEKIRGMETETTAYAQGRMASAAYWIGSAADEVYASPLAEVGSIGVFALLTSKSEKLSEEGIDTEVIRSTPLKGSSHPSEPIDEKSVKKVQRTVDRLHEEFVREVATNRNLSEQHVSDTMADGDTRVGSDAEEEGFTDGTLTLSELYEEFEFDEGAEGSRKDQQISFLEDNIGRLLDENRQKSEQIENMKTELESLREQSEDMLEAEIESRLDKAIQEDKKFAPAKREELREQIEQDIAKAEGDVNLNELSTIRMIDMVDEGAAAPEGSVETPDKGEESIQTKVDLLESQGIIVASGKEEAQYYEDAAGYTEGKEFVLRDKIGTGAYDYLFEDIFGD